MRIPPRNHAIDLKVDATTDPKHPQRWVMFSGEMGPCIAVEQLIRDEWHGTPGSWYVSTLIDHAATWDTIAIDGGQGWKAKGVKRAVRNACRVLAMGPREDLEWALSDRSY